MPVFLLSLCAVLFGLLLTWSGWKFILFLDKKAKHDVDINTTYTEIDLRNQILGFLKVEGKKVYMKNKNMDILKIRLMEKFNLKPKELKDIIITMEGSNLVISDIENVAITPFGIEYYNFFIKPKRKK